MGAKTSKRYSSPKSLDSFQTYPEFLLSAPHGRFALRFRKF